MTTYTSFIIELHKNPFIVTMVVTCGMTDGQPDMVQHVDGFEYSLRQYGQNRITVFHTALPYTSSRFLIILCLLAFYRLNTKA
jgi:hypothetical protein